MTIRFNPLEGITTVSIVLILAVISIFTVISSGRYESDEDAREAQESRDEEEHQVDGGEGNHQGGGVKKEAQQKTRQLIVIDVSIPPLVSTSNLNSNFMKKINHNKRDENVFKNLSLQRWTINVNIPVL